GVVTCSLRHHDATGQLVGRSVSGDGVIGEMTFPPGTGASGRAVATRRPIATTNILLDPRITLTPEQRAVIETRPYRSMLALPMIVHDRVVGAIAVGDREGRVFDVDEMRLAQTFTDQAAMALERARWFRDAEQRRRGARGWWRCSSCRFRRKSGSRGCSTSRTEWPAPSPTGTRSS